MRTIRTARLVLEPQAAVHAAEMFAVLGDPALYEFENSPPPSLEWLAQRFAKLETRRSADGAEDWLNWVVRLGDAGLIGYVQATVRPDREASIAYEFASAHWGRGYAGEAVEAMMRELASHYRVDCACAVAKRANLRSLRLLERLGFAPASAALHEQRRIAPDEILMRRDLPAS